MIRIWVGSLRVARRMERRRLDPVFRHGQALTTGGTGDTEDPLPAPADKFFPTENIESRRARSFVKNLLGSGCPRDLCEPPCPPCSNLLRDSAKLRDQGMIFGVGIFQIGPSPRSQSFRFSVGMSTLAMASDLALSRVHSACSWANRSRDGWFTRGRSLSVALIRNIQFAVNFCS